MVSCTEHLLSFVTPHSSFAIRCSMAHGINNRIDPYLVGIRGVLRRVARQVCPLPGVSQVGIPVDDYHQPAVLVEYPATVWDESVLFIGYLVVQRIPNVGHLQELRDIIKTMKERMAQRDFLD